MPAPATLFPSPRTFAAELVRVSPHFDGEAWAAPEYALIEAVITQALADLVPLHYCHLGPRRRSYTTRARYMLARHGWKAQIEAAYDAADFFADASRCGPWLELLGLPVSWVQKKIALWRELAIVTPFTATERYKTHNDYKPRRVERQKDGEDEEHLPGVKIAFPEPSDYYPRDPQIKARR